MKTQAPFKSNTTITVIVVLIAILSAIAAGCGIWAGGAGVLKQIVQSVHGESVMLYGRGLYRNMSADVAIQGIAQDYVTLFIAVPLLLISLAGYRKGIHRSDYLLTGILGYFLVTYTFYLTMAMYNALFLVYSSLMGLSFFAFIIMIGLLRADVTAGAHDSVRHIFKKNAPVKFTGSFLIFNSVAIAFLWLGVVVPPLIDGTIYPHELNHYTTLIVQGFDLGLLLPLSFLSGWLLLRKRPDGYLFATIYIIFLSLLMSALTAKIIAIGVHGGVIIPAVFIIPPFNIITIVCAILMLKSIKK
jgi:hypothetical protein